MPERLQKVLARAGFGSRRSCEVLIKSGKVSVDGAVARLGQRVDPILEQIEVDGKRIQLQDNIYIILNKPRGIISSTVDELNQGRPTVIDIVGLPGHLYPVGRLDKNSQGLILLTNDGELTHKLTHPRYEHSKSYRVAVEGEMPDEAIIKWRSGIWLDGRKTAPVEIKVHRRKKGLTHLQIIMREGRKRQIRRTAAQLGYPVVSLIREKIGPIKLGDLPEGKWRYLTENEVKSLKRAAFPEKSENLTNEVINE
ncbi:MAG: hypothetical protein BMS9Abin02_1544 [Anaerolineae bacterium]|nr:MAG: hypothetical protein BMS9Abin02_1544 [Anaerolineae bacterium]